MSKYRIVRILPEGYKNSIEIQYKDEFGKWQPLLSIMHKTYYDDFPAAESIVVSLQELDKWNATHGKYQVLKEYD